MSVSSIISFIAGFLNNKKRPSIDEEYKEGLKRYCDNLVEIVNKSNEQFEKQLSYISGGALGISFVVIDKVLKDISKTQYKWILISGWGILTVTLLLNLLSHKIAINYHKQSISDTEDFLNGTALHYDYEKIEKRNGIINKMNNWSLILLSLGLISLIFYTSINIVMSEDNKKQSQNIPQQPTRDFPKVPDQSSNIEKGERGNASNTGDGKVPNIVDKGHSGLPPKRPSGKK